MKQPLLPGVIVRTGKRKMPTERYRRVTLVVPPAVEETLRRIAAERFVGNMSAATAWAIALAAATLDGPLRGLQVPANPVDAIELGKRSSS